MRGLSDFLQILKHADWMFKNGNIKEIQCCKYKENLQYTQPSNEPYDYDIFIQIKKASKTSSC